MILSLSNDTEVREPGLIIFPLTPVSALLLLFTGSGVFAKKPFDQGDFISEYRGELISASEAQRRRELYTPTQRAFMFHLAGKSLW